MNFPADDLYPKHDELAMHELSLEELDAVAAGSIFGRIYHFIKDEVNGKVNEYKTAGRLLVDSVRDLFRTLF